MELINVIIEQVEQFNKDLARVLQSRKFIDTGKALRSLKIRSGKNFVQSIGVNYLEFLNRGSRPWSDKSFTSVKKLGYILHISGWAKRKGLNPYAVAASIVKKGSQVFRGKRAGIEADELVKDFKDNLRIETKLYTSLEIKRKLNCFSSKYNQRQKQL